MKRRASGILLHITSLPSLYGIGDLGPEAYRFVDFLAATHQDFWQILPLNPTSTAHGNSPYSSYSAFAGNPLLISPDLLVQEGLLTRVEVKKSIPFSKGRVNYKTVTEYKTNLFHRAFRRYQNRIETDCEFQHFCRENADWLEDYALFVSLRSHFKGSGWSDWPSRIRDRNEVALREWRWNLRDRLIEEKFLQYFFFKQWTLLKQYCNQKNVQIIGDLPFYVHYNSSDVWSHPEIFKLDAKGRPQVVAAIPPDYFSSKGQLWGNPIYRWNVLKEQGYGWWVKRVGYNLRILDIIRLDHFKGFVDYWEVRAGEKTAIRGRWVKGPGEAFFNSLLKHFPFLPFIAEDLGVITAEVHDLRDRFELPGMRVLQFAFGNDPLADHYKPYNYSKNCVVYSGTHDNDTLIGWLYGTVDYSTRKPDEIRKERRNALQYLGYRNQRRRDIHWELIRLLMMSSATLVIIPFQDILGLGEEGRMNRPATEDGNWEWRLHPTQLSQRLIDRLSKMTIIYGRA